MINKIVKSKREMEIYTHLNAEFQRITRRDKKAFLRALCGARSGVGRPHGRGESGRGSCSSSAARAPWRAAAGWPERQVRGKGRRSAGLLGRPAAAAPVYGHTTLNAPDLV